MRFLTYYKKTVSFGLLSALALAANIVICQPGQAQKLAMGLPSVHSGLHIPGATLHSSLHLGGRTHSKKWIRGAFSKLPPRGRQKPKSAPPEVKKPHARPAHKPVVGQIPAGPMLPSLVKELAPGVSYVVYNGHPRINMVDIDMSKSPMKVRALTASYSFNHLKDVREHARDSGAIAAINANYFKRDGVPLGTLMVDGEWVAGPLFDRVALGFTEGGYARMARVGLHGILSTSNPEHQQIWINNVNQPHRTGSRCILYTRRWGERVTLPFAGTLLAVDASGQIIDRAEKSMAIPYGGFVLCDSKKSPIADLASGELVHVKWQITPGGWDNVKEAVSGGPLLLQNGKFACDLKGERFPANWTGGQIVARTACGITADDHLLMATFEGPHTLYDVAKFFLKHGCTEAMNLDGGGSTTMVVNGTTVTRNGSAAQRHVAVALGIFSEARAKNLAVCNGCSYHPKSDLASFTSAAEAARISAQAGVVGSNNVGAGDKFERDLIQTERSAGQEAAAPEPRQGAPAETSLNSAGGSVPGQVRLD
ncbi:MAG: phosphodiester glycosidase family protein [Cyanobacteria bacterium REEB67]|nr:phosphodiester glycosidase family protein [Cyanobacteria bacterium REEB67]